MVNDSNGKGHRKRIPHGGSWIVGILGIVGSIGVVLVTHALGTDSQPRQSGTPVTSAAGQNTAAGGESPAGAGPTVVSSAVSSQNALQTQNIGAATVLTNAAGYTLYWFSLDTPTASMCNGSCNTYWTPVSGPVTEGPGVTGQLGTITRSDGSTQATYNGHPLYTYVLDLTPLLTSGNGVDASGGEWHEVTV